ncbi:Protein of unknown function [Streptomyces sp. cf124]|nr:Protein of unknown function [Streptomyces sp. cf124]
MSRTTETTGSAAVTGPTGATETAAVTGPAGATEPAGPADAAGTTGSAEATGSAAQAGAAGAEATEPAEAGGAAEAAGVAKTAKAAETTGAAETTDTARSTPSSGESGPNRAARATQASGDAESGGSSRASEAGEAGGGPESGESADEIDVSDHISVPGADGKPVRGTRRFPLFTRDTARPEGGGRAAPREAPAPVRQWPILAVLSTVALGLLLTALDAFRVGTILIGVALLAGAALRWAVRDVGMLAVRSRFTDMATYIVLGTTIVLLALMAQPRPLLEIPFLKDTLHFSVVAEETG